jgi:hypothetical protein
VELSASTGAVDPAFAPRLRVREVAGTYTSVGYLDSSCKANVEVAVP